MLDARSARSSSRRQAGFTLLEMIIVIAVLGMALGLVVTRGPMRSQTMEMQATVNQVAQEDCASRAPGRSRTTGIFSDRWAASSIRDEVWPASHSGRGQYQIVLALPRGLAARRVTFSVKGAPSRSVQLQPGETRSVRVGARGFPVPALRIVTDKADYVDSGTPSARFVAVRIPSITYVSDVAK